MADVRQKLERWRKVETRKEARDNANSKLGPKQALVEPELGVQCVELCEFWLQPWGQTPVTNHNNHYYGMT